MSKNFKLYLAVQIEGLGILLLFIAAVFAFAAQQFAVSIALFMGIYVAHLICDFNWCAHYTEVYDRAYRIYRLKQK